MEIFFFKLYETQYGIIKNNNKAPGPGEYSTKSTFRNKKAATFGRQKRVLGGRREINKAQYIGQRDTFNTGKKNKFSIPRARTERGFLLKDHLNNPGPGQYEYDPLMFKKKASKAVIGRQQRKIFDLKANIPGVGQYDVDKVGFFKVKKNQYTIGRSKRFMMAKVRVIRNKLGLMCLRSCIIRILKRYGINSTSIL